MQATGVQKVRRALERLSFDPAALEEMRGKVRAIRKPRSAYDVADSTLEFLR